MNATLVSIVMPAFNEAEILATSVADVVAGMQQRSEPYEIIVVENGSTDNTLAIARELETLHPTLRVEHRDEADYGAALRHGLLHAKGEFVVNFDCDYYDLDFVDRAMQRLHASDEPAIVVGSKRTPGSDDRRTWARRSVTAVFTGILRVGFGLHVSDTHGMKAMRRDAVDAYARLCVLGRDLFDTELILRVERAGLVTTEIPVTVRERRPARTPILERVPRTVVGLVQLRRALR